MIVRVLVTGASGLTGRYIVDELARRHSAEMLDIKAPHRYDILFYNVDLLNKETIQSVVKGFDSVVYLAGIPVIILPLDNTEYCAYAKRTQK